MPRIPDPAQMQRADPSGTMSIATVRNPGVIGQAIERAAGDVKEVIDSHAKYEFARAKAEYTKSRNQIENELAEDADYATHDERYQQGVQKSVDTLMERMRNPYAKRIFNEWEADQRIMGTQRVHKISRAKEVDHERATVDQQLADLREVALNGDIDGASSAASELIQAAVGRGYLSAEEAGEVERKWLQDSALGLLNTYSPADQIKWLESGEANERLPRDVRLTRLRQAQAANQADAAAGRVQGFIDGGLDETQAYEEAATIEDPGLRQSVEREIGASYARRARADLARQDEVREEWLGGMLQNPGTDPREIEGFWQADMSEDARRELINMYQNSQVTGSPYPKYSDPGVIDELNRRRALGDHVGAREFFSKNYSKLSSADFSKWSQTTAEGTAPVEIEAMHSVSTYLNNQAKSAGIDDKQRAALDTELQEWMAWYQKAYNKVPNEDERLRAIDQLLIRRDEFVFESGPEELTIRTILERDPEGGQRLLGMRQPGQTDAELIEMYTELMRIGR